ncbi:phosphoribosylglycinamide formyltransferase [Planctomycetota bacterium]
MFNIAVLLSGSGTTLQNLIDRISDGSLPVKIAGVISSAPGVKGIERAHKHGLETLVVDYRQYKSNPAAFSQAITGQLQAWQPDLVVMAGFLRLYDFPPQYEKKIINIHPALLPKFGGKGMFGLKVQQAILAAGEKISGCTVHYVDHEYDHGPTILQLEVPVAPGDTPETLQEKVQAQERIALPRVIKAFALGEIK